MDEALIIEVLQRRERVAQRIRLDRFPATIGRALSSDVVLDDPYVCPLHLRLTRDAGGALRAEDAGSVNGVFRLTPDERVTRVPIHSGLQLRIGHTVLRFRRPEDPVEPSIVDRAGPPSEPWLQRSAVALLVCVLAGVVFGVEMYLESYEPDPLPSAALTAVVLAVLVTGWVSTWALVNRVVAQEWRVLAHAATVCAFGLAFEAFSIATDYYGFVFSAARSAEVIGAVGGALLLAGLLDGHLALLSPGTARRRRVAALLAAVAVVGTLQLFNRVSDQQFSSELEFAASLKPVPAQWLPAQSVDQFLAGLDGLKREVDLLAEER